MGEDLEDEDGEGGGVKDQATEQEMEKLLLDNMTSEEEEEGEESGMEPAKKKRKKRFHFHSGCQWDCFTFPPPSPLLLLL